MNIKHCDSFSISYHPSRYTVSFSTFYSVLEVKPVHTGNNVSAKQRSSYICRRLINRILFDHLQADVSHFSIQTQWIYDISNIGNEKWTSTDADSVIIMECDMLFIDIIWIYTVKIGLLVKFQCAHHSHDLHHQIFQNRQWLELKLEMISNCRIY